MGVIAFALVLSAKIPSIQISVCSVRVILLQCFQEQTPVQNFGCAVKMRVPNRDRLVMGLESARGLAQSKSCRHALTVLITRSVLDCGSPLPLYQPTPAHEAT